MRAAHILVVLAAATAATAVALTVPSVGRFVGLSQAQAANESTLYVSGLDIGPGRKARVRLRNTSTFLADVLTVNYSVRDPSIGHQLSPRGLGAQLRPGDTLDLDLGAIVDAYRASIEVGDWSGPVQFVAFGEGGHVGNFGPKTVQVEAIQTVRGARFALPVEWIED